MKHDDVDGIVFWTKNFRPFMRYLPELTGSHIPFIIQYTINGYPQSMEHHVVESAKSIETVRELSDRFGHRCVVWRYDTIIFSRETPRDFHLENFQALARDLKGATDEVVISFLQLYQKTAINLNKMVENTGNQWWEPHVEEKRLLAIELNEIAMSAGITLTLCSQPEILTDLPASRCIDSKRIADVAGRKIQAKTLGKRPGCECAASRDIGDYDTCPHGCVYCYAVRSHNLAVQRFKRHDPESEFLFTNSNDLTSVPNQSGPQPRLFE